MKIKLKRRKEYLGALVIFAIFSIALFTPGLVLAEELEDFSSSNLQNEVTIKPEDESTSSNEPSEDVSEEIEPLEKTEEVDNDVNKNNSLETKSQKKETVKDEIKNEEHKVTCITTKVDEDGKPLKGAVLQIIDSDGNVVDEWTSDGTEHETSLYEGDYTLHEVSAPEGYKLAADKTFTVKVEVKDLDAGVDFSETPCPHYEGTPLYYVEIEGKKYEVYCINQDWETPDENSKYDGKVLNPDDLKNYTTQTVYTDAHQNKGSVDISDQSLSKQELYDKILDIIYHREKASSLFSDLSEAEIRYVTESALKNYTNAGLTRVQRVGVASAPANYESTDYYITDDGRYMWYLYPWYRSFVYDPDAPLGKDIFKTDIGNGDAFGTLARHWSDPAIKDGIITGHNAKNSDEARAKLARYYELYLYLISDTDHHPSDMHLYIFSTINKAVDLSGNNSEGLAYQNLLGIHWYNPDDENHKVYLTLVNEKAPNEKQKKKKQVKKKSNYKKYEKMYNPHTGDSIMSYILLLPISLYGMIGGTVYIRTNRKEY